MAHVLRQYREGAGISVADFSKALSVSRQSLYRIEAGDQTPSVDLLRRIVEVTSGAVTPNDMLLPREEDAAPATTCPVPSTTSAAPEAVR